MGASFPQSHRQIGVVRDGGREFHVDAYALQGVMRLYTRNSSLGRTIAYRNRRVQVAQLNAVVTRVEDFQSRGLIWGFSGYAEAGHDYTVEGQATRALFNYLRSHGKLPSLVVTGGVSDGIPGLGSALAASFQTPSMGFIPLKGLDSFAPCTYLVAHKPSYREREILVGVTGDILVCEAGAEGTIRECEEALKHGAVVLMLAPRKSYDSKSLPSIYANNPVIQKYRDSFIICRSMEDIPLAVERAIQRARGTSIRSRSTRVNVLRGELA